MCKHQTHSPFSAAVTLIVPPPPDGPGPGPSVQEMQEFAMWQQEAAHAHAVAAAAAAAAHRAQSRWALASPPWCLYVPVRLACVRRMCTLSPSK